MGRSKLSICSCAAFFYATFYYTPLVSANDDPPEVTIRASLAEKGLNGQFANGEGFTRFKLPKNLRDHFKGLYDAPHLIVSTIQDGISNVFDGVSSLVFNDDDIEDEDASETPAHERKFIGKIIDIILPKKPKPPVSTPDEILPRPTTPTLRIDTSTFKIGRDYTADEIAFLNACDMEIRLGLDTPFARNVRKFNRSKAIQNPFGALVYDDGSIDQNMIPKAFNGVLGTMGDVSKTPVSMSTLKANPYNCDFGNHATAVSVTMRQAFGSRKLPITVVGGDMRIGNYSDGNSIDERFVASLSKDLKNAQIRKDRLGNPVVLNASYGIDYEGDIKDKLDEGGLWSAFWDFVPNSVVVQAAGNESKEMSGNEKGAILESAYNMQHVMENRNLWGRFVHAMASIPTKNEVTGGFDPNLAISFSNYYRYLDSTFSAFARDHSMMAPGDFVLIPLDAFDQDRDRDIYEKGKMLTEWSGTSAAAPCVTGCVLRLVNEYNLTALQATKVLLDSADLVYVDLANGLLKNMNLGAAIIELERQKVRKDAVNQVSLNQKYAYFEQTRNAFFGNLNRSLELNELNHLLYLASQLNVLETYTIQNMPVFDAHNPLYDLSMHPVQQVEEGGLYINLQKSAANVTGFKIVYVSNGNYLKDVSVESVNGRTATFRLTYDAPTEITSHHFAWKGIIDADLTITKVAENGTIYDVAVKAQDHFISARTLTLLPLGQVMAGSQNVQVDFDVDHFVMH